MQKKMNKKMPMKKMPMHTKDMDKMMGNGGAKKSRKKSKKKGKRNAR